VKPRDQTATQGVSLWQIKLLYLVVYSSYGTTSVYRTLYYRRIGLTGTEIGILISLQPLIMLVAGPLWSILADRLGWRSRLLTVATGASILPLLSMVWIRSFYPLVVANTLYSLFLAPVQPLMDSIALTALGRDRHRYSNVRAYGSLGYAPVMWLTGLLIQGHDIRWTFLGYTILMGLGCLLTSRTRIAERVLPKSIGTGLGTMLRSRQWLLFMVAVCVAMMAQGVTFGYVGLHLDSLGASEGLIGLSGALGSAGQTLLMMGALPWMLRRWGARQLMLGSLAIYALRLGIWALVPVPWIVATSQVIMGLSYGASLVACVDYADRNAPEGMSTTSQALVTSLVSGIGRSAGAMTAGPLYDAMGPKLTFGAFGLLSIGTIAVLSAIWRRRSTPS
jgi:PPP family 3-phenylpropionic acid transporter